MKRLFWKLNTSDGVTYNLQPRIISHMILEIVRLPITVLKYIFNTIDNGIDGCIQVRDCNITAHWKNTTKADIKKGERIIYKQLID